METAKVGILKINLDAFDETELRKMQVLSRSQGKTVEEFGADGIKAYIDTLVNNPEMIDIKALLNAL